MRRLKWELRSHWRIKFLASLQLKQALNELKMTFQEKVQQNTCFRESLRWKMSNCKGASEPLREFMSSRGGPVKRLWAYKIGFDQFTDYQFSIFPGSRICKFERLVHGCIEADFCRQIFVGKRKVARSNLFVFLLLSCGEQQKRYLHFRRVHAIVKNELHFRRGPKPWQFKYYPFRQSTD